MANKKINYVKELNSIYGCSVSNQLNYSTIFQYSRKAIADIILTKEMDSDVIYFDTDSIIKYRNHHEHVFEDDGC